MTGRCGRTAGRSGCRVWLLVAVVDSVPLLVTSAVLVSTFVPQSSARTRKAATALARDLDLVIAIGPAGARPGVRHGTRRPPVRALRISGATGLDTGLGIGWWGVPALHPRTLQALVAGTDRRTALPAELLVRLRWHRAAANGRLDAAA